MQRPYDGWTQERPGRWRLGDALICQRAQHHGWLLSLDGGASWVSAGLWQEPVIYDTLDLAMQSATTRTEDAP